MHCRHYTTRKIVIGIGLSLNWGVDDRKSLLEGLRSVIALDMSLVDFRRVQGLGPPNVIICICTRPLDISGESLAREDASRTFHLCG